MTINTDPFADARNSATLPTGSTNPSAPDKFDATERDIVEGDQKQIEETEKNPQKDANGNPLENDGLDHAGSETISNSENNPETLDKQNDR
ncbi:hypothetical protein ACO0LF_30885 [Undibacterium sp. Di27W]|uniref:hypothetical protein n=1 Tax=Undibacterium sp. Di27W TaxID=3413036 RepID=UPI003BF33713